jgi:ubiquinone/menaquinone biosynthesis C-methylase UbiE
MTDQGTAPRDDYFAAVADSYDRLQPIVAGPWYRSGLDFVCELVPYEPSEEFVFVELGCGTATLSKALLDRFPRSRVIAADSEPGMLEIARQKLACYRPRATVEQADIPSYRPQPCDLVVSSFVFHHVAPETLPQVFERVAAGLGPGGCFILLDQMTAGPTWGDGVAAQSRRLYREGVFSAIAAGLTTQAEIDARWEFKRKMKAEGKDVEYRHGAEDLLSTMQDAGFAEVGLVWRMFASTILVAFVPAARRAANGVS